MALQIVEQFRAFGAGLQLRDSVVIGGTDMQLQAREIGARPHVVVATPGRLAVGAWACGFCVVHVYCVVLYV